MSGGSRVQATGSEDEERQRVRRDAEWTRQRAAERTADRRARQRTATTGPVEQKEANEC